MIDKLNEFSGTLTFVDGELIEVLDANKRKIDPQTYGPNLYVIATATVTLQHGQSQSPAGFCNVYYGGQCWKVPC